MKLDEAIEILQGYVKPTKIAPYEEIDDAIQLGIEAMKAIKCGREGLRTEFDTPLPGETKD